VTAAAHATMRAARGDPCFVFMRRTLHAFAVLRTAPRAGFTRACERRAS
jgi:hypothetical protein